MKYETFCVTSEMSIKEAMKRIDDIDPKILFVMEQGKLIASLTDGDIRRYLFSGGKLEDACIAADNRNPRLAFTEEQAASLYHSKHFVAIPVVDEDQRLRSIYFGTGHVDKVEAALDLPVVINAGGKGSRLEPYTKVLPKPLIPVGELPIIEHIMQRFEEYGCNRFSIIVNYKKELMKAYFQENERKYDIRWYDEQLPLGTGGGLGYLRNRIQGTFFFSNCDTVILADYESMLQFHRENRNMVTMVCAYKTFRIPYGVIEMGMQGRIEKIQEKPELSFLTNTGVYLLEPEVFDYIGEEENVGFPEVIDRIRADGGKVAIFPISENDWLDMGQHSELERMRLRLYGE